MYMLLKFGGGMRFVKLVFVVIAALFLYSVSFAADIKRDADIVEVAGKVEVKNTKGTWIPAQIGMKLNEGDVVRTMEDSFAVIKLNGSEAATVEVKKNSQMRLAQLTQNTDKKTQSTMLDLALGDVLIKAQKLHSEKSKFEVKTPTSIVGVRGTTFSVSVEAVQ
ncbi:MAG: FecR domain-containing protein [Candidatus Omnitrophota bacterium]